VLVMQSAGTQNTADVTARDGARTRRGGGAICGDLQLARSDFGEPVQVGPVRHAAGSQNGEGRGVSLGLQGSRTGLREHDDAVRV
jgi:hypothetical protein